MAASDSLVCSTYVVGIDEPKDGGLRGERRFKFDHNSEVLHSQSLRQHVEDERQEAQLKTESTLTHESWSTGRDQM